MSSRLPFSRPAIDRKGFSEGARLLWRFMLERELSQKALSEMLGLGAGGGQVSLWLYGRRRPGLAPAINIEEKLGIPAKAWTESPSEHFELPGAADAPASSPALPDADDHDATGTD